MKLVSLIHFESPKSLFKRLEGRIYGRCIYEVDMPKIDGGGGGYPKIWGGGGKQKE